MTRTNTKAAATPRGGASHGYIGSVTARRNNADKRQACDMCRKKKIKCDGKMPQCTHCINYKTECIFTHVEKKRQPPKGCVIRVLLWIARPG